MFKIRIMIWFFCSRSVMFSVACLKFWISVNVFVTMGGAGEEATSNGDASEQRFAIEPQDQTAIVGSRVTLPCRVINKLGSLQWTRDDFALGTHRSLTEFFRYAMIGSDEEGAYRLYTSQLTRYKFVRNVLGNRNLSNESYVRLYKSKHDYTYLGYLRF